MSARSAEPTVTTVALGDLLINVPGVWRRPVDPSLVAEYAEQIEGGARLPRVTAFGVEGTGKILTDGAHRLEAHRQVGKGEIQVDLHQGTLLDAKLHAVTANTQHGRRLTREQKREAVLSLLADPDLANKTDRAVGKLLGVSHEFVRQLRREMIGEPRRTPKERPKPRGDVVNVDSVEHPAVAPQEEGSASDQDAALRASAHGEPAADATGQASAGKGDVGVALATPVLETRAVSSAPDVALPRPAAPAVPTTRAAAGLAPLVPPAVLEGLRVVEDPTAESVAGELRVPVHVARGLAEGAATEGEGIGAWVTRAVEQLAAHGQSLAAQASGDAGLTDARPSDEGLA